MSAVQAPRLAALQQRFKADLLGFFPLQALVVQALVMVIRVEVVLLVEREGVVVLLDQMALVTGQTAARLAAEALPLPQPVMELWAAAEGVEEFLAAQVAQVVSLSNGQQESKNDLRNTQR
jgi:hypothetical protein